MEKLEMEVNAWNRTRNKSQKGVDWQFKTEDVRVKLRRLYPIILED